MTTGNRRARRTMCVGAAIALAALTGAPVIAQGQLRSVGELGDFATNLSQTCPIPEGVAVDERTGTVFASSLGALALLLWITANDAEEIQALSPTGRLIARVRGIGVDATRNPAALAFRGRRLVITNFDARSATPGANSKLSILTTPSAGRQSGG